MADVGTDSSHLLIAEVWGEAGGYHMLDALKDRRRLGDCLDTAAGVAEARDKANLWAREFGSLALMAASGEAILGA